MLRSISLDGFLEACRRASYVVIDQDKHNWCVARGGGAPYIVPKHGGRVTVAIVEAICNDFFATEALKREIQAQIAIEQSSKPTPVMQPQPAQPQQAKAQSDPPPPPSH